MGYRRSKERNRRLQKLYDKTKNSYGAGVYFDEHKNRLVKYSIGGSNCKRFLKRRASKKMRKYKNNMQYNNYKKTFDYWWELF